MLRDKLHVRRFVHPESVKPLRFRDRVNRKFGQLGTKSTVIVTDDNLHATIAAHRNFPGALEDVAKTMRMHPDSSDTQRRVGVLGADTFGLNHITRSAWFGLALEDGPLRDEYGHYAQGLDAEDPRGFAPHVALFRVEEGVSPELAAEINNWIEQAAPSEVLLKPISVRWSVIDE